MSIPEPIAIYQGLVPAKGFAYHVNTITVRGKSNVAKLPFLIGFTYFTLSKINGSRLEKKARRDNYKQRMAAINEECKTWTEAGKVLPPKLLVENERKLKPTFASIYV